MIPENELWENTGHFSRPEAMCNTESVNFPHKDAFAFVAYDQEGGCYYWACIDMYLKMQTINVCIGTLSVCVDMTEHQLQEGRNRREDLLEFLRAHLAVTDDAGRLQNLFILGDYIKHYKTAAAILAVTAQLKSGEVLFCPAAINLEKPGKKLIQQLFDYITGEHPRVNVYAGKTYVEKGDIKMQDGVSYHNATPVTQQ